MALDKGQFPIRPWADGIPEELRALPCWRLWKVSKTGQKIPCHPDGTPYRKGDEPRWGDFESVWEIFHRNELSINNPDGFAGIQLSTDLAGVLVLDGDNICEAKMFHECNTYLLGYLTKAGEGPFNNVTPITWTEYSPSGRGMHWIMYNPGIDAKQLYKKKTYNETLPNRKKHAEIEVFTSGPICITGRTVDKAPADLYHIPMDEAKQICEAYLESKPTPTGRAGKHTTTNTNQHTQPRTEHTNEEILQAFAANPKFSLEWQDLYAGYSWERNIEFSNTSYATIALLNALTYFLPPYQEGDENGQIKELFEDSKLFMYYDDDHVTDWYREKGRSQRLSALTTRKKVWDWQPVGEQLTNEQMFGPAPACPASPGKAVDPADLSQSQYKEPMLPLDVKRKAPFPMAVLPLEMQGFINNVAEEFQIPPDFTGMGVITMASIALSGKYKVQVKEGYQTPLNVFSLIVGTPGVGKSSIYDIVTPPLWHWRSDEKERLKPIIDERDKARNLIKIAISETEKALRLAHSYKQSGKRPKDSQLKSVEELEKELNDLIDKLDQLPKIYYPTMALEGNFTVEAFTEELANMDGHLSIISEEGSQFIKTALGRYEGGANVEPFIKLYEGKNIEEFRISRGMNRTGHANGGVLLFTQPKELAKIVNNEDAAGQGFIDRFAIIELNEDEQKEFVFVPDFERDKRAYAIYNGTMYKLFSHPYPEKGEPVGVINMTREAYMMWGEYNAWAVNQARNEKSRYYYIGGYMAKLANKAVRFAGILHALDHQLAPTDVVDPADPLGPLLTPTGSPITAQTMQRGIDLANYCLSHFAYQNGCTKGDTAALAVKLISYILSMYKAKKKKGQQLESVTLRDLLRKANGCTPLNNLEKMRPVLEYMEDCNILTLVEPTPGKRGRTSNRFMINQNLFTREGLETLGILDLLTNKAGK